MDTLTNRDMQRIRRSEQRDATLKKQAKAQQERVVKKEMRAAEQARELSDHAKKSSWLHRIEDAPVYRPTAAQFANPMAYIQSISEEASKFGICKIIPPYAASTSCFKAIRETTNLKSERGKETFKFGTRQQAVRHLPWDNFSRVRFWAGPQPRSLSKFSEMADSVTNKIFQTTVLMPSMRIEGEYWRNMGIEHVRADEKIELSVEYGDNVEGTGFSDCAGDLLGSSQWNLNKLPSVAQSTLRLLKGAIPGVTEPMLYIGMLFSTFCWHVEDLYLYSINFHHAGAPKTWYGVPSTDSDEFERVALEQVYAPGIEKLVAEGVPREDAENRALAMLLQKTTTFSPELLMDAGVKTVRCQQNAGEFVLTFPRAYHSGFSQGYNFGEAVNFAPRDWFPYAADGAARMRRFHKLQPVPLEQLACLEMLTFYAELKAMADASSHADSSASGNTPSPQDNTDMASWLLSSEGVAALNTPGNIALVTIFCRLVRWEHRQSQLLLSQGAQHSFQQLDNSVPCACCKDMSYLSCAIHVTANEPCCLRCWKTLPPDNAGARTPTAPPPPLHAHFTTQENLPSEMFIFSNTKLSTYRQIAADLSAVCLQECWGAVIKDDLIACGMTDRLHETADGDYMHEDLTVRYDWAGGGSPPSTRSELDAILLDAEVGDARGIEDLLMSLVPAAAADVTIVVPRKLSVRGRGVKRSNTGDAAPQAMLDGVQDIAALKPDTNNALVTGRSGRSPTRSNSRQSVIAIRGKASPVHTHVSNSDGISQQDPDVSQHALADSAVEGGRRRAYRAAAETAMARWKSDGGRPAPEDLLAADDAVRQQDKKRRKELQARDGRKRDEQSSSPANVKSSVPERVKELYDNQTPPIHHQTLSPSMHLDHPSSGHMSQHNSQQNLAAMSRENAADLSYFPPPSPSQVGGHPMDSLRAPNSASSGQHAGVQQQQQLHRQGRLPDPWLSQLESSAALNSEVMKLLSHFCTLPTVESVYPPPALPYPQHRHHNQPDSNGSLPPVAQMQNDYGSMRGPHSLTGDMRDPGPSIRDMPTNAWGAGLAHNGRNRGNGAPIPTSEMLSMMPDDIPMASRDPQPSHIKDVDPLAQVMGEGVQDAGPTLSGSRSKRPATKRPRGTSAPRSKNSGPSTSDVSKGNSTGRQLTPTTGKGTKRRMEQQQIPHNPPLPLRNNDLQMRGAPSLGLDDPHMPLPIPLEPDILMAENGEFNEFMHFLGGSVDMSHQGSELNDLALH